MVSKILSSELFAVVALVLLGGVCVLILCSAFSPTMDEYRWQEEIYTVQQGDSLWSLAGKYCPEGVARGEWVDEVQRLNDLENSLIFPGDDLIVLVAIGKE